jgi:GTP-binding protein
VVSGTMKKGQSVSVCSSLEPGVSKTYKTAELMVYDNFNRVAVEEVKAGDICALTGISDIKIGETICAREFPNPLPTIKVEDPTVSMVFKVNTSPFAGKEGKYVTSRNLKERLDRELERNLALRVNPGETADAFIVSGRGALHLGILIENMRREGYEFEIGPPKVITKEIDGKTCEPYEEAIVEVPDANIGAVVELFAQRKGEMVDLAPFIEGTSRAKFRIATRGLLGLRNALLTATRGMAVMNTIFLEFAPSAGEILMRDNGSLIATETGDVTSFALESAQERGVLFCRPGDPCYENQCVGMHAKAGDLRVNVCKTKQLTNMRVANKEIKTGLDEPRIMSLDDALEYINDDEQVEVTPKSVRIRKDPYAKPRKNK